MAKPPTATPSGSAAALDHFSGGENDRLGLIRAWLRNRPVEVLDEPPAFLDSDSAQRVRAILRKRARLRLVLVAASLCVV